MFIYKKQTTITTSKNQTTMKTKEIENLKSVIKPELLDSVCLRKVLTSRGVDMYATKVVYQNTGILLAESKMTLDELKELVEWAKVEFRNLIKIDKKEQRIKNKKL